MKQGQNVRVEILTRRSSEYILPKVAHCNKSLIHPLLSAPSANFRLLLKNGGGWRWLAEFAFFQVGVSCLRYHNPLYPLYANGSSHNKCGKYPYSVGHPWPKKVAVVGGGWRNLHFSHHFSIVKTCGSNLRYFLSQIVTCF